MATIKDNCIQINNAVVYKDAYNNFRSLTDALHADKGLYLTIEESYFSVYEVIDNLRSLVQNPSLAPSTVRPLLDPNKTIQSIVQQGNFGTLKSYVDTIPLTSFEPTIEDSYVSVSGVTVFDAPNRSSVDPRRCGRYIKPGPTDIMRSIEVQKWIINNAPIYGFVPFSDDALFFIGPDQIRKDISVAIDKDAKLKQILTLFMRKAPAPSLITTTAQQVLNAIPPSVEINP